MPGYPLLVTLGASTPSTFPSAADYWQKLADQIGSYMRTTVSDTQPSGEPGRWVVADELKDDEDSRDTYAGGWIYVRNGDQTGAQRRLRSSGLEGPFGAVAVTSVLTLGGTPTNLDGGTIVEMTHPLPIKRNANVKGLFEITNEGLERVWVPAFIPLAGNGTTTYSLSGYAFVTSDAQVDAVYDYLWGIPTTEPPVRSGMAPTIKADGASITLETGYAYSSGDTFYLKVFVPANRLIMDSTTGVWGYTTAGLVHDADQAAVPIAWWLPVAMVKGLQYLRRYISQDRSLSKEEKAERLAGVEQQMRVYAPAAARVILAVLPKPEALPPESMLYAPTRTAWS